MRTPRVGITTYVDDARWSIWDRSAALLPTTYVALVRLAGGAPVLLPPAPGAEASVTEGIDALIIAGGPDVDPARYAAERNPRTGAPREVRDGWELALLDQALDVHLPVLGVCRGIQVLNVAYGGTLHQHTPDVTGCEDHRPAPAVFGTTRVRVNAGTRLHAVLGAALTVRCHHHQSLDTIGAGLVVSATAPDGVVEAVEDQSREFVLGVQWHPEEDADELRLMSALVDAARTTPSSRKASA